VTNLPLWLHLVTLYKALEVDCTKHAGFQKFLWPARPIMMLHGPRSRAVLIPRGTCTCDPQLLSTASGLVTKPFVGRSSVSRACQKSFILEAYPFRRDALTSLPERRRSFQFGERVDGRGENMLLCATAESRRYENMARPIHLPTLESQNPRSDVHGCLLSGEDIHHHLVIREITEEE